MGEQAMSAPARVLPADDHEPVLTALRRLVERIENENVVAEALDGRRAVELAAKHRSDVAVLDISMRELNGIDAAEQIRSGASRPQLARRSRRFRRASARCSRSSPKDTRPSASPSVSACR